MLNIMRARCAWAIANLFIAFQPEVSRISASLHFGAAIRS